jgi:hypothetical protein
MDYKAIVAETPHVVKYIRKAIQVPKKVKLDKLNLVEEQFETKVVKCGVVVALRKEGKIQAGWSICSDQDQFSRAKGKAIAILRAKSGKSTLRNVPEDLLPSVQESITEMAELAAELY